MRILVVFLGDNRLVDGPSNLTASEGVLRKEQNAVGIILRARFVHRSSLKDAHLHYLRFERLKVQQDNLARLAEFRDSDRSHNLFKRAFYLNGLKLWLIADEEDVRTFLHDKGVTILIRVTPQRIRRCGSPESPP